MPPAFAALERFIYWEVTPSTERGAPEEPHEELGETHGREQAWPGHRQAGQGRNRAAHARAGGRHDPPARAYHPVRRPAGPQVPARRPPPPPPPSPPPPLTP